MPVEGFPDRDVHKLCRQCGQWHEVDEGIMIPDNGIGPLAGLKNASKRMAGDDEDMKFVCDLCLRANRVTMRVFWSAFIVLILVTLMLERLGVIW